MGTNQAGVVVARSPVDGAVPPGTGEAGPAHAVRLLGSFRVHTGGLAVRLPAAAQRLVAFLAVSRPPVQRAHVAGVLWPEVPEERAAANLRTALWRCRQAAGGLVEATACHLRLGSDVGVDLREAEVAARRLLDPTGDRPDAVTVLDLLSTDLLVDWYEDWVLVERERFRQLRLHAVEALCERLTAAGCHALAVEAALAAVAAEPLRESAHRALISAHLAEGNTGEALRQYRSYQHLARTELGVGPSTQLRRLLGVVPAAGR